MPSVVFWQGIGGGTAHYRCRTPGKALARAGWDVSYVEDDDSVLSADVLVLQRVVAPEVPDIVRALQAKTNTIVVYDIDDWYDGIPGYNPASQTVTATQQATCHELMGLADVVTVSTAELAEGYSRFGRTVVLPNYLDPEIWGNVERFRPLRPDVSKIHVGWMGAFHWRSGDLELLKTWVPRFLESRPEVVFVAAGCPELLDFLGVAGITSPPLYDGADNSIRPYEHLPAMLLHMDVGLVPLAFNRFNQAKSYVKGLESNRCGVPVVASPSREYRQYIRPGINGLLVRNNNWTGRVEAVIDDLDAYRDGARKVAAEYLIDDHIHRWVDAYQAARQRKG